MGGAASKIKRVTPEERIQYIKRTPFFLYLQDETLKEFANCFTYFVECKEGETLTLDENKVYIVAKGELELSTAMAEPSSKIEYKGYLCKKHPGDIVCKHQEQQIATKKVG